MRCRLLAFLGVCNFLVWRCVALALDRPPRIAILGDMPPFISAERTQALVRWLRAHRLECNVLTPQQLANPNTLHASNYNLLILPNAPFFPETAMANLLAYLKHHGRLLCLGGPAFVQPVFAQGGRWWLRETLLEKAKGHAFLEIQTAQPQSWQQAADSPQTRVIVTKEASPHGTALVFSVENYQNWVNLTAPPFSVSPFTDGENLTMFWAKGAPGTNALVMEWVERDGSRWIAAVPLSPHWKRYVLLPSAFRFWEGGNGRGKVGDAFHPQDAVLWRIGLANSHALQPPGSHKFWIADLEVGASPYAMESPPPDLPSLCPDYRGYTDSHGAWRPVVRERGIGAADEGRPGRLLLPWGLSNPEDDLDNSQWVYLPLQGPYLGALWGGVALAPDAKALPLPALLDTVQRLLQPAFLAYAGASQPAYPFQTPMALGAKVVNCCNKSLSLVLRWQVRSLGNLQPPYNKDFALPIHLSAYGQQEFSGGPVANLPPGDYLVEATLLSGSETPQLLDRIREPVRVLPIPTRTASLAHFVRVEGGEFVLDGKPWRPVGVNFWPGWVAGQRTDRYWRGWLSPDQYDPELVQRDLEICHRLGFNVMSVQYTRPDEGPALNDFLIRCRNLGIKANVFLAYAHPLFFDPKELQQLLAAADLRGNDTVFAFDVAWEPRMGDYNQRKAWDPQWHQWLQEQYGSIAHAETVWGMKAPRDANGEVTGPSDQQLSQDGPWRPFVAAYRRFLDDLISRGYAKVVRFLRPYGPLIGARSGYGGNGSLSVAGVAPFDLLSGAAHLDFISPEGYALDGEWPQFRGGGFTAAYARWAGNGKPVFWAEFGRSVLPANPQHLKEQASYYDKMCRLIVDTGSNGTAAWWFPGGLRIDEHSDFGIISPDGTPRTAALRLSQLATDELPKATVDPQPNVWLEIDRDSDARGYAGLYQRYLPIYARLREEGKVPGVKTRGTGTTTANVPLTAVGDLPLEGLEPLQFVNGEILPMGPLTQGVPQELVLTNTGEPTWVPQGAGHVELLVMQAAKVLGSVPLKEEVPRYGQVAIEASALQAFAKQIKSGHVTLRLAIVGRPDVPSPLLFGQQIELPLNPEE